MKIIRLFFLLATVFSTLDIARALDAAVTKHSDMAADSVEAKLSKKIQQAWEVTWSRFYLNKTHLFYDYISSYEIDAGLNHLPGISEIKRQTPNECGYDTGMEDCMISAGIMMSMILDRYAVTQEEDLKERAYNVYQGIKLCATGHGVSGFLARGVSHEDLVSIYANSSRDQYTHAVYALWLYARSSLSSPETQNEIGQILSAISDRMERNVIQENNFDSLRADGSRDTRGISRMWNVEAHEAARLPMIYAATWDVTKNERYRTLWKRYSTEAIHQSSGVTDSVATYAMLQAQESLSVLLELETDPELLEQIHKVMSDLNERCAIRGRNAFKRSKNLNLNQLPTDWRTGGGLASPEYRKAWYCTRECGEATLVQLTDKRRPVTESQSSPLNELILELDFHKVSSHGIFYIQAAYWKSQRNLLTQR